MNHRYSHRRNYYNKNGVAVLGKPDPTKCSRKMLPQNAYVNLLSAVLPLYRAAIRRAAAPTKATPVGMPPAAPPVDELLCAEAVLLPLAEVVREVVWVPVEVVAEPVEVVKVPLEEPEGPTTAPVPVVAAAPPVADAVPVAAAVPDTEPSVAEAVAASELPVTVAHWLLNAAKRLDCSDTMVDCSPCASDCRSAPVAVTVACHEANWLLIETAWSE